MKTRVRPLAALVALALLAPFSRGTAAQKPGTPFPVAVPQTRLEQFLAAPDQLLIKDSYRIDDRLTALAMQALVVTAPGPQEVRMKGLRVDVRDHASPTEHTNTTYLDFDELQALSAAIGSLTNLANRWVGAAQETQLTEVAFTSIAGFSVGLSQDWQAQRAFVSSGFVDPVHVRIDIVDLIKLKSMVDQASAILQRK